MVFTESEALQAQLRATIASLTTQHKEIALLMMSSGTFDGINIKEFAKELIEF